MADRARWYSGWGHFRHREWTQAAEALEAAARARPRNTYAAAMFYWAARARLELGEAAAGEALLRETVIRYKHGYHGQLAARTLAGLPGASPPPLLDAAPPAPGEILPDGVAARVRALLLLDRKDDAEAELRAQPDGPQVRATLAWIEGRRGRLRPAIVQMKRAFPQHVSALGDQLPAEVWQVLYPLAYAEPLAARARAEGLDPALVAALVLQESTFDAAARSRAGALGLMQILPRTGREIARSLRLPLHRTTLTQPDANLLMGMTYLRRMLDSFGGRVERALAAYNAGPGRVRQWTAGRPDVGADEFVEDIPFQETRHYVMTILAARAQYQRLYALARPAAAPAGAAR